MATAHTHGRGGAGNTHTGPKEPVDTGELQTPTIKQQTYTTGRGGSGNMASNDNAENARKAQDVEGLADAREKKGTFHWGRGGEGNMATIGKDEKRPTLDKRTASNTGSTRSRTRSGTAERKGSWLVEKGKEKLGLKGQKATEGSAIED